MTLQRLFSRSHLLEGLMQVQSSIPKYIHLADVDSTNNYVANLVRTGNIESGTVVSADFQQDGRGQRATKWQSLMAQNALFSIYLKWEKFEAAHQFQISMLTALAIAETLEKFGLHKIEIKWPNDIQSDNQKIAGILIENELNGNMINSSILGIGLNVNQIQFDSELKATSMKLETGQFFVVQFVIQAVALKLLEKLKVFQGENDVHHEIKKQYLSKLKGYQKEANIYNNLNKESYRIKVLDVSKTGQLLASNEHNQLESFDIKDIVWK
jgi:BirA family transcriptional regulator, biotin operon repressor / biotin---[acetyl-CoA-carboxylase] ligase